MDENAPEIDQDVVLQKSAKGDLPGFEGRLRSFLWNSGGQEVRRHVRIRDTDSLVAVLEQFQEQPQLLDPYLQKIVPPLAEAFIQCLQYPPTSLESSAISHLLTPLSAAICRLLYTFCKIRGEKVIVRFLSTETKHLELLLSAIEGGIYVDDSSEAAKRAWTWEERYATLLWLSQLLLAPFDLESISSASFGEDELGEVLSGSEVAWPANTPTVSQRVISLAFRHLSSSGREREAAKLLLVRIALRPDMQKIGILDVLVQWATKALSDTSQTLQPVHRYIGILSFLAGLLSSSTGTNEMNRYLYDIFRLVEQIQPDSGPIFASIHESAVARKNIIKIYRGVAILLLRTSLDEQAFEIMQGAIVALLGFLGDESTPVRLAASKALSMVVPKLDSDMSVQVVQAIVDELENGISWHKTEQRTEFSDSQKYSFTDANVLLWHGHILTLSQLLYRRAISVKEISSVLDYVVAGLSFEKRDVSGLSVGTSVRDAACFGVWALARRYTTVELKEVHLSCPHSKAYRTHSRVLAGTSPAPIVQQLAIELIVSASLDPAGNIRRGSSAALQELVGRHPDAIANGISLVQVIDYHAVARRSTALREVAFSAAGLSHLYFDAVVSALLGWRGIRDASAAVRRDVANVFGQLTWSRVPVMNGLAISENIEAPIKQVLGRYLKLPARELNERHGLLLCAASAISGFSVDQKVMKSLLQTGDGLEISTLVQTIVAQVGDLLIAVNSSLKERKPTDLLAESVSSLIVSVLPLIRASTCLRRWKAVGTPTNSVNDIEREDGIFELCDTPTWPPEKIYSPARSLSSMQTAIDGGYFEESSIVVVAGQLLAQFLNLMEQETIEIVARTCANYIFLLDKSERRVLVESWVEGLRIRGSGGRYVDGNIITQTLFYILPVLGASEHVQPGSLTLQELVINELRWKWATIKTTDNRVWLLRCLRHTHALQMFAYTFTAWIEDGLNDYTINSQGDIGRHVRIEALKTAAALGTSYDSFASDENLEVYRDLFGLILRSAAEKNDSVRQAAKQALVLGIPTRSVVCSPVPDPTDLCSFEYSAVFVDLSPKSQLYFEILLKLPSLDLKSADKTWLLLMQGYVTSAHAGSEDIINASRAAIASVCAQDPVRAIDSMSDALWKLLRDKIGNDRIIVSLLEVISFLFDAAVIHQLENRFAIPS
ncbi:putative Tubulin-specific chaperone D [Glarea lozoyensis 74030]|uniref:Putative Tubulin-specific chaperone D n=1 Tax=Glarea lozoyensis (strain ATCC 74030 / MF5533) TaxID=1104152 RepID=H0EEH0_GLAL7|nr:putative Tubulin-specific chaperone D [Glarea lozoyensis 74030]